MKKMLMAIGMAAVCAFGGVFDDCVYLFEGGLDANGNGYAATGEIRDELHAGVNNIKLTVTSGGCYYFDYHRFQLVPPADGTYLIVR